MTTHRSQDWRYSLVRMESTAAPSAPQYGDKQGMGGVRCVSVSKHTGGAPTYEGDCADADIGSNSPPVLTPVLRMLVFS